MGSQQGESEEGGMGRQGGFLQLPLDKPRAQRGVRTPVPSARVWAWQWLALQMTGGVKNKQGAG